MNSLRFLTLALCLLSLSAFADDKQVQYRITGLFQPDRIDDLHRQASELQASKKDPAVEVWLVDVNYDTAVATFAYDPASKAFKGATDEKILQHINNILSKTTRNTFTVHPLSGLKPEQLKEERIEIEGLDCKGCAYGAYLAVEKIEGVERATVSFKDGLLKAWIDPSKTQREALVAALSKAKVALKSDTPAEGKSAKK